MKKAGAPKNPRRNAEQRFIREQYGMRHLVLDSRRWHSVDEVPYSDDSISPRL